MKCNYCGCELPRGVIVCLKCKREIQIVPDYNPLDDYLAENVKQSINEIPQRKENTGRVSKTKAMAKTSMRSQNTRARNDQELRRKQAERKRKLKQKRRRRILLAALILIIGISAAIAALYISSYNGTVNRGYKALQAGEYSKAEELFQSAISKDDQEADAYIGLADCSITQGDVEAAEQVYLKALEVSPNADVYAATCEFYLDSKQELKIPGLLEDVSDSLAEELGDYITKRPNFSLDDSETFDDVQQLSLECGKLEIRYTTDGSDPTMESTVYEEPIQLAEGATTVKAIAINEKGVPSKAVSKDYVIEFPIEDAPAVSPSTGQYDSAQKIEIKVPDGYTAYYTTDGSDPTVSSHRYEGPISMPEGEILFKAVLINAKGRSSGITTRNYVRN